MTDLPDATFRDGPLQGRTIQGWLVPWSLFIPRDATGKSADGFRGPSRSMAADFIRAHDHYALVAFVDGKRVFEYKRGKESDNMDYIYIRAWARLTRAWPTDLSLRLAAAREDPAPPFALYKDVIAGTWITLGDITDEGVRTAVEEIADRLRRVEHA